MVVVADFLISKITVTTTRSTSIFAIVFINASGTDTDSPPPAHGPLVSPREALAFPPTDSTAPLSELCAQSIDGYERLAIAD